MGESRGEREKERAHDHCDQHFKSFIMQLFDPAYFSKFYLGHKLREQPELKCAGSYSSSPL